MTNHLLIPIGQGIPNLALMKVSAFLKRYGHHVELDQPTVSPDEVWISCPFTWEKEHALQVGQFYEQSFRAGIHYGGTAFDWGLPINQRIELPPQIDRMKPDYDLYDDDRAVGFSQRGCNRKCQFCDVWRKEGRILANRFTRPRKWMPTNMNKCLELSNDIALLEDRLHDIILNDCRNMGVKLSITQGYDIRCIDERRAALLAENKPYDLKFTRRCLYIAWDYMGIENAVRKGIEILLDAGFRGSEIMCYTIIGFNTTMEENLHRHEVLWDEYGVHPFAMLYNRRTDLPVENAFARWTNRVIYKSPTGHDFAEYLGNPENQTPIATDPLEAFSPSAQEGEKAT